MRPIRHFTTRWLCAGLFFVFLVGQSFAQTSEELYKRLEDSMISRNGRPASYDFSWVTPQIRAQLIQYASVTSVNNLPNPQFISPNNALLYLGDSVTVEKEVSTYHQADGAASLTGPPEYILPYLINDLTHASSENHIPFGYSLMDKSLMCSFNAIARWPSFPSITRAWAADSYRKIGLFYHLGPNSNANHLMREWWEHNKDAILLGQYGNAKWLPPMSEEVADGPITSSPLRSSPLTPPPPLAPAPKPQAPPINNTEIPVWLYGIVVLGLGVGTWLVIRLKK